MRSSYLLIALGFLILLAGAAFALNHKSSLGTYSGSDTITSDTSSLSTTTPMASLKLTSSAFEEGSSIPSKYTCDGPGITPPLSISGVPAGAKSLALIIDDPDIPQQFKDQMHIQEYVHWVLFNIP